MGLELDLRVDAGKDDPAPVVLAGPDAVHFLIVLLYQRLPPLEVLENPLFERVPEGLLLLRRQGGLLGVEHPSLLTVQALHGVIDADIQEVQRILQDAVGVGPAGVEGAVGGNIDVHSFLTDRLIRSSSIP